MAVLRYNLLMLAVGGLTMAAIAPRDQADAQSGQALAFAEHACLEYGVHAGDADVRALRCECRQSVRPRRARPRLRRGARRASRQGSVQVIWQNADRD